jgi:hypothetical protein
MRQHYAAAIFKARTALEINPDLPSAYQIIAACSCEIHEAKDAKQAASHLDAAKRALVQTLCEKRGVVLGSD